MEDDFDDWYLDARASLDPALTAWCGDAGLAADALDEAFVRAVERWDRVRSMASPSGWVWQTATNIVRSRARRHQLERRLLLRRSAGQEVDVAGPSGDDVDLRRALLTLTERQRTAVVLFYIADLPTKEIGDVMEIAVGTVGATLHRARQCLAEQLGVPPEHFGGDELQHQGETR